jgi:hypothetical protein
MRCIAAVGMTTRTFSALAGNVVVLPLVTGNSGYGLALRVLTAFGVVGLVAAMLLPARRSARVSRGPRGAHRGMR